ncbi:hypothetical protein [Arthrobacter sp. PAMC25564]|uniref:hypothetical protein n=1 Tax=Arthrobacter sp. PAMC25564 TaxID=2565366 RepID=UPI00144506D7|nr:hypothetical protein [Arthrobacter sp. PAMC25564]
MQYDVDDGPRIGGVKTVTTAHVAGVALRNQRTLDFARYYPFTELRHAFVLVDA